MHNESLLTLFPNHEVELTTNDDLIVRSAKDEYQLVIRELNLNKLRSIKIQSSDLGEPSENRWVCLVLAMEDMEPMLYLIPSLKLADPDDFIFKYNKLDAPFEHLSNYEIKVFRNGMEELSKYAFENMIGELV